MSKICAFLLFTLRLRSRYAQGERGLIRLRTDSVHEPYVLLFTFYALVIRSLKRNVTSLVDQ